MGPKSNRLENSVQWDINPQIFQCEVLLQNPSYLLYNLLAPPNSQMAKMKEKKSNISGKPKHSLDTNRSNGTTKNTNSRSAATVRRLQMYSVRPKRDSKGKILKHDFQSNELPNTRIQPDRRWFGMYFYNLIYKQTLTNFCSVLIL